MNGFDIGLLVLLGLLVVLGLIKGLARVLIGIAAVVAAFILAAQFHHELSLKLSWIRIDDDLLKLLAYLLIFLGTMLAGGLLAWFVRRLLKAALLSWADRLAGAAVGLVAAVLVAGLVVLPVLAYAPFGERALRDSVLAPYVTIVADMAEGLVPDELSVRYKQRVEDLRAYWRERWEGVSESVELIPLEAGGGA